METRVVLVTGASSGIGKAIGTYLSGRGFRVFGTTRTLSGNSSGSAVEMLQMDVRNTESIGRVVKTIFEKAGRLDVVVNNAGIGITGPVEETPFEEARNVFEVNLLGPVAVMRAVLPAMRQQGSGLVINISSIAGYMGLPFRGYYSASKGALELLTESIRMETAKSGIRITSLAPGDFATNIASGRYHSPVLEGSPYEETYRHSLNLMDAHVSAGKDPELVARKILRIIQTRRPKVHYTVGSPMQRFSLFLKSILPDKLFEKLLSDHYKL